MHATSNPSGDAAEVRTQRNHMLIAGPGRAGTSFLVRYLSALGLETAITHSTDAGWDEHANAGFESLPIIGTDPLPYVIKSPWISEFIEQILRQENLKIDVVIIPVRDLAETAASRVILQMRAMHEQVPRLAALDKTWETWGVAPGGVVFSLNPLDQARILAVWFYNLVQRLIDAGIPIVFLGFPKLALDGEYLFTKLRAHLPDHITLESAQAAFHSVADYEKIRVGDELAFTEFEASTIVGSIKHPGIEQLDQIAIRREIERLNAVCEEYRVLLQAKQREADEHRGEVLRLRTALDALDDRHNELASERDTLARARHALTTERDALIRVRDDLIVERDALASELDTLARARSALTAERDDLIVERDAFVHDRSRVLSEYNMMLASRSWRLTAPLRWMRGLLSRRM